MDSAPELLQAGLPVQLLQNRPDVRQAEAQLQAAKWDIKSARAAFFPSMRLFSGFGFEAFKSAYLFRSPASQAYTFAGDLMAPLVNKKAIKADFKSANARQIEAAFAYEQCVLTAFVEVQNQLSNVKNLKEKYQLKSQQVAALVQSNSISNTLFASARADYMEVLLTQRDALEARFELVETKKLQFMAMIQLYQALGGGWK